MNFESLVGHINQVQDVLQAQAAHAVNLSLTARNWLVGYYIVEYEQHGEDRAKYGDNLINRLADRLNQRGFNPRRLRDYRHVYQVYPILGEEICRYLQNNRILSANSDTSPIWLFSTAKLQLSDNQEDGIWQSKTAKLEKWQTPSDRLFYSLLLCTDYGVTTVQYATEGLSQNLFVSKYRLQLPSEDDIKQYLLENISEEKFKELKEEEENVEQNGSDSK